MRAITKGHTGEDVKELQRKLVTLGYDPKGVDGVCGNGCLGAIMRFQMGNGLTADGWAGSATQAKLNELVKPTLGNKVYRFGAATVIEVDPMRLQIDVVNKKGTLIQGEFINGTLFYAGKTLIGISTLAMNGGIIAEQGLHDDVKRGTLVIYKNGQVKMEMIDFISRHKALKDIKCAIGGFNLLSGEPMWEQFKKERFDYNSVGYRTWRSMLGYSKEKNKILVVIAPNMDAQQGSNLMKKLGCDLAVGLDGGGSTCGRFNGDVVKTTSRVIHNIIRW